MGLKLDFDVGAVTLRLRQTGERAVKHGIEEMRDTGEKIVETAKDYAPHDLGNLEDAIKILPEEKDRQNNFRKMVVVGVDPNATGSPGSHTLAEYAFFTHEGMGPYGEGWYPGPGKGTRRKGEQAGGKYLERAFDLHAGDLREKLARMYRRLFK